MCLLLIKTVLLGRLIVRQTVLESFVEGLVKDRVRHVSEVDYPVLVHPLLAFINKVCVA